MAPKNKSKDIKNIKIELDECPFKEQLLEESRKEFRSPTQQAKYILNQWYSGAIKFGSSAEEEDVYDEYDDEDVYDEYNEEESEENVEYVEEDIDMDEFPEDALNF